MAIVKPITRREREAPRLIMPLKRRDDFGPEAGWEFDFAAKHSTAYPVTRTIADIVPFMSKIFPSGRKEFAEMSVGGKALDVGLDALMFVPVGWIGTGLKYASRPVITPVKAGIRKLPFVMKSMGTTPRSMLDRVAKNVDKFVYVDPKTRLMNKFGLDELEIESLLGGGWIRSGRGGARIPYITDDLKKIYTKKGVPRKDIYEAISKAYTPRAVQRLGHHKREWERLAGQYLPGKTATLDQVFNRQVERVFGKEQVGKLTLENIGDKDLSKLLMDTLLNRGKITRGLDVSSKHYLLPIRKVMGFFEGRFGTFSGVYLPTKRMFGAANKSAAMSVDQYHKLLAQHGLLKFTKRGWKELYKPQDMQAAGKVLRRMDDMQSVGAPQVEINRVVQKLATERPRAATLVKAYHQWTDFMYGELMKEKIPQMFRRVGLTERGIRAIETEFSNPTGGIGRRITALMADSSNIASENKITAIRGILDQLKRSIEGHPRWFKDAAGKNVQKLKTQLSLRQPGSKTGFANYLENYSPRIFEGGKREAAKGLPKKGIEAAFTKARLTEENLGATENLIKMVESRARAQSKELYVYPYLPGLAKKAEKLPKSLRNYTDHYFRRMLGTPSPIDDKVAAVVNKNFGTAWSGQRVMDLAWRINDLVYMGGIGFKPFSAMRNYFQPFLMVPADMGGIKDFGWLARGYARAFRPGFRTYMKEIGAITEYAPDLLFKPVVSKLGKGVSIGGREFNTISMQRVRDASMWMFKMSDRHNRFVTGGAAATKWEYYLKKFGSVDDLGRPVLRGKALEPFKRKVNLRSREPWVREEIERLMDAGRIDALEEAKKLWVKDVVADTQYLYGPLDAPLVGQVGGSVTRTAVVFQSWWMNYGSALGKWMARSGGVEPAAIRMFNWMVSAGISAHLMEDIWGKSMARRTVLFGPLPLEPDIPASWKPFAEALKLAKEAGEIAIGRDPADVKKRMKAVINSSLIYVPAGLQIGQIARRWDKGDAEELFKALMRYRSEKD